MTYVEQLLNPEMNKCCTTSSKIATFTFFLEVNLSCFQDKTYIQYLNFYFYLVPFVRLHSLLL